MSAVRLCIKIAQNRDNSEDGINNLINSLVKWIKYRSAEKERLGKLKEIFYSDVKLLKTVKEDLKKKERWVLGRRVREVLHRDRYLP